MAPLTATVIGTGGFARNYLRQMIQAKRSIRIIGLVEPSPASREGTQAFFEQHKAACPPFYNTIKELIRAQGTPDVAGICSPHKFHFENTRDCLLNGTDVCLEKPMVMNADEARRLIRLRDKTKRLLVVGFPGSLSPAVWKAKAMIAKGALGRVTAISGFAHQNWKNLTVGKWRQDPAISGGGFLFDTGSHMVNTVVDLLGEEVTHVAALLDNRGTPVEITSTVSAKSASGVMVSLCAAGDSIQCCSQITIFGDKGILQTGIWGEFLRFKKPDQPDFSPVTYPKKLGVFAQFLKVRAGKAPNPCPPEVGLRFAKLMDMIRKSADTGMTVAGRPQK